MSSNKGWIKLHRSITDNILWQCEPFSKAQAWIDLLLMANIKDGKILAGNVRKTIKRGSLHTSINHLMIRWRWGGRHRVIDFLHLLENEGMIRYFGSKSGTTITIVKYGVFQDLGYTNSTDNSTDYSTDNSTDSGTDNSTQSKNGKNAIKNAKEIKNTAGDFSKNKPPKIGDIRFSQCDQYGNEWWERCVKIDPDGYVHWKGCWKWELKEFQEGKL